MRSMLHRAGLRFRKDRYIRFESRGVKADIVFPSSRLALFIDGCFWHRCPEHAASPTRNSDYWQAKFKRNVERDRANNKELQALGWRVVRIWEHEIKDPELAAHAVSKISHMVRERRKSSTPQKYGATI